MSEVNCISGGILRQAAKLCAKQDARTLKLLTSNNSSDMLTPWPRHKCKFTSPLGTDYTTIIFWLPHPRDDRNAFPTLHPRASSSLSNPKDLSKATAQLLRHFFLPSSPSFIPALLTRDLASIQRQQETPPPPGGTCLPGGPLLRPPSPGTVLKQARRHRWVGSKGNSHPAALGRAPPHTTPPPHPPQAYTEAPAGPRRADRRRDPRPVPGKRWGTNSGPRPDGWGEAAPRPFPPPDWAKRPA